MPDSEPGVERADFVEREPRDLAAGTGGAVGARVVHQDEAPVARRADIHLDVIGAGLDRRAERGKRVLWMCQVLAAMRDDEDRRLLLGWQPHQGEQNQAQQF